MDTVKSSSHRWIQTARRHSSLSQRLSEERFRRNTFLQSRKVSRKLQKLVSLGGFPVLGVHANVYDGSYHEVDSSEMAFHIAGSMAFKDAMNKGGAILLEPIMKVEVTMPEEYMGDVIGDINSRRRTNRRYGRHRRRQDCKRIRSACGNVRILYRLTFQDTGTRQLFYVLLRNTSLVPKTIQEKVLSAKGK